MEQYDIIFLSETHCNGQVLPNVNGFIAISDPKFPLLTAYDEIAAYIKKRIFDYVTNIRFTKISISFSLSCYPRYCYMAVCMYPMDSINYSLGDFGILLEEIEFGTKKGYIPFIGGDFNARVGDLNKMSRTALKWRYEPNIDTKTNSHGKQLMDICHHQRILPINHCIYYNKSWDGKYTYYKAGKQSQIDFCLTSQYGRNCITKFKILDESSHISDHLPLALSLSLSTIIDSRVLLL